MNRPFKKTATIKSQSALSDRNDYSLMDPSGVYPALGTSQQGLSNQEAKLRYDIYGPNELPLKGYSRAAILLRQFRNPMFVILIAAAAIAAFFGQFDQSIIMILVLALSALLGFYNESKAERIVGDLRKRVSITALVTREGKTSEMDSTVLVPGDLVSVHIGDIITADMRIVESNDLEIDESVLTGESFAVEKGPAAAGVKPTGLQQATNYLFMGTVVVHGSGRAIVFSTGKNTEFGSISQSLARIRPETEFQRGIKSYGNLLITLTFLLSVGIFAVNAVVGHSLINSLLFALAIAIGLVPELMPAIVTITLSRGAHRMAKEAVIVKRLPSIENLGNMDILCTDKTGTLTEGGVILREYFPPNGGEDSKILLYSLLCSNPIASGTSTGNPMDVAIWNYVSNRRPQQDVTKNYTRLNEIPFDFHRRMVSAIVQKEDDITLITKGAPESVLPLCRYVEWQGKIEPLDSLKMDAINLRFLSISEQGYRMLAVAYRSISLKKSYVPDDESDLILAGFLVFTDPPKEGAKLAIAKLNSLGVNVKVLTGDNDSVAKKICQELGIPIIRCVIGSDLIHMSLNEFKAMVEETTIFARVNPEQKLDIIKVLKDNGHVTGYMGDGVNDAPSLYEADAGISVDTAVDISKEAADIILLKKDLGVLANGIEEGRKTFGNTIKYVLMGTSSNFGNMFSAAAASVFLPFLPMLPMQILVLNLLYDLANMTLPADNVDAEYIKSPQHWDMSFVRRFTLFFGPFSSLYDFLTFGVMLFIFGASASLFQTGWFIESFWTEILVIFAIRTLHVPFFKSRPGKWLTIITLASVAFGTSLPFTPLGRFLGFTTLPIEYWALLILMVVTYLLLVDAGKIFFYRIVGR